MQTSCTE
jgi:arylsulfatase A-like enzyme